jgi:biotin carboxyl carrier protein
VRARVSGYLQSVGFRPGQIVEANALLFVIDPRPYQAALDRAKAASAQSRSALELARNEARRAGRLVDRKAISQEEYEARTATLRNAEAEVQGADAAVRNAQLDLEFTQVRSPIRGRVSRDLVNVGNLVNGGSAGATLLTTVVSLDPIHCYFEVDERAVLKYTDLAAVGRRASSRDAPNPCCCQVADETGTRTSGRWTSSTTRSILDRHAHGPRDLPEPRSQADAGPVRARAADRQRQVPTRRCCPTRDRHRPGRALRVRRRRREQDRAQESRDRPDDRGIPHRARGRHDRRSRRRRGAAGRPSGLGRRSQDAPLAVPDRFRSVELPENVRIPDPPQPTGTVTKPAAR